MALSDHLLNRRHFIQSVTAGRWMDPSRRGNLVFLTQVIGIGQAAYTVPAELSAALEGGLKEPA